MSRPGAAVHLGLFLTQVAFASLAVEGKIAMAPPYAIEPAALAMLRIGSGAVFFAGAHVLGGSPRVRSLADCGRLAALALFGVVINQALFLLGLRATSPMAATLLVATIPIFAAVIAAVAGREPFTVRRGIGIGLAVFGVAILSRFALPAGGDLFVLLNAASYAVYVVFAKGVLARYGTTTVIAWVFGWGAILFAPVGLAALVRGAPTWSAGAWAYAAFVVLVPTVFAYAVSAWALRKSTAGLVTIYIYLQPLVVAVLAYIQLGLPIEGRFAGGGALILAGVALVATGSGMRARGEPLRSRAP